MKLFYKFYFWLPFFSCVLIMFELIAQPAKSLVWTVIDPVFSFFQALLPDTADSIFILFLLHFLLALLYGCTIDALIK